MHCDSSRQQKLNNRCLSPMNPSTWGSGTAGTGNTVNLYYKGIPATL